MDVVVWALWIWIALSAVALVVYVFRRVRYNRRKRAAVLENKPLPADRGVTTSKTKAHAEPLKRRSLGTNTEPADEGPTGPPVIFNNSTAAVTELPSQAAPEKAAANEPNAGAFAMGSLLAPRPDAATPDAATRDAGAPKTDAPKPDAPDTETTAGISLPTGDKHDLDLNLVTPNDSPEPTKTLADVLAGVRLPYDLLPVDEPNPQIADVAVTLVSMTTPAADVGMALADELERLGYEIFSLSDSEAVAKRGTDSAGNPEDIVSLVIRTGVGPEGQPMDSVDADQALPSAVAVDVWVGGGDSPLQKSHRTSLEI